MKEIAVGIHGHRIAQAFGQTDDGGQIGMQGGLAAQKNQIAGLPALRRPGEERQPLPHRVQGEHVRAMLRRVDVAVPAVQIAGSQQMQKHIAFTWLETDSAGQWHRNRFVHFSKNTTRNEKVGKTNGSSICSGRVFSSRI